MLVSDCFFCEVLIKVRKQKGERDSNAWTDNNSEQYNKTKRKEEEKKKLCENVQNDEIEKKEMITNKHQSNFFLKTSKKKRQK